MIELKNVSKYYNNGTVTQLGLRNISLKLNKGEIVAITGESGSGKTTLLNVLTKNDTFDEGEYYYYGNETSYFSVLDADDFKKNKVGFIFQNYNIIDSYTVLENVMLPLVLKGYSKKEAKEKALELISKVGLKGREKHRGTKLSGGEKQRCVIARALASDCDILACDEPTGNLDSNTAKEIINLIKEVAKDKLVLIVTHNLPEVEEIMTRLLKVSDGEIIEDIVIEPQEDEEAKELNLDYKPLPKKTDLIIARNNIRYTPRKTILLGFIMLVIFTYFLFQLIVIKNTSVDIGALNQTYAASFDGHLVVYNVGGKPIEDSALDGYTYNKNSFAEERESVISFGNRNDFTQYMFYLNGISDSTLYSGTEPKADNEVAIFVHKDKQYELDTYETFLNKNILLTLNYNDYLDTGVVLTGIYAYENSDYEYTFLGMNAKIQKLMNYGCARYSVDVIDKSGSSAEASILATYGNKYNLDSKKIKLIVNTDAMERYNYQIDENKLNIYMNGYNLNDYDIHYISDPDNYDPMTIEIPLDLDDSGIYNYFCSIDSKAPESDVKKISSRGVKCVETKEANSGNPYLILVGEIVLVVSSFAQLFNLMIVFFITFAILKRVYASKGKDYEILRTLGVTKKDMSKIVKYETIIIGMVVSVIVYLVALILKYTNALSIKFNIGVYISVFYFVISYLFLVLLARRYNVKLYKYTVARSMKGENEDD